MAGELATDYGITGWKKGDASRGVRECFNQWRADFGKGDNAQFIKILNARHAIIFNACRL
jgi:hypothetical protein